MLTPGNPSWDEMHYRLISLWELMQQFDAGRLIDVVSGFSNFGQTFLEPAACLLPNKNHQEMKERIEFACEELDRLGFRTALRNAIELKTIIFNEAKPYLGSHADPVLSEGSVLFPKLSIARFKTFSVRMQESVRDALAERVAIVLPISKEEFFQPKSPLFGAEVDLKFKKAGRAEISEAGKCLALDRPTACVFHLMRTVEVGLEAIRLCLGLPAPTKGQHKAWGAAVGAFQAEIDKRNSDLLWPRQWNNQADKSFFEKVQMALIAIKDGCRDDTMHIESVYTMGEAEHIYALTKGFMQRLASRLDEDGLPRA